MSRSLSATALQSLFAQSSGEILLVLLEITHADLATPIRVVNDVQDLVHGGNTYTACPFRIALPSEEDGALPRCTISIDNVNYQVSQHIRTITSPPSATIKVVLASSPDTVEAGPFQVDFKSTEVTAMEVSAEVGYENILDARFPYDSFDPANTPGLFERAT